MPDKILLFKNIYSCPTKENLLKFLLLNLSPVLKKIKPSELIVLKRKCFENIWKNAKNTILKKLGLSCKVIYVSDKNMYILFYDPIAIQKYLFNRECQKILIENGYKNTYSLQSLLYQLKNKMREKLFPHEIGVFLGYPVHDVKSFIRYGGKDFCFCKYWKVYSDIEKSVQKFQEIDLARNNAATLLSSNMPLYNAVKLIKTI